MYGVLMFTTYHCSLEIGLYIYVNRNCHIGVGADIRKLQGAPAPVPHSWRCEWIYAGVRYSWPPVIQDLSITSYQITA